ncbi:MAG: response regulator [Chloroflexota bacterium]
MIAEVKNPYDILPDLTNSHVLVVEDEPNIRRNLIDILETDGYVTSGVESGREALQFLIQASVGNVSDKGPVELVLLDVMFPYGVSGLEVLNKIRGHPNSDLRDIRVIMLTAVDEQQQKIDALTSGADDYITKPYHPAELLARAQTLLRSQKLEKELMLQREQFAMLNTVGQKLSATFDMRTAYREGTKGLRQILNVEATALFVQLDERKQLLCHHLDVDEEKYGKPKGYQPVPYTKSILVETILRPAVMRVNKPETHSLFNPELDAPPGIQLRSILSLPVVLRGGTWGVIAAYNKINGDFTEFDVDLTASFSTSLANTIHNAYLVKKLIQTGKLAAIGQLSAGVAHEISNPLVAVIANAEMLKMSLPKGSDDFEAADLILQGGERAQTVVKGLLDFSREQRYAFQPLDLNQSVQQALNLVSYQLKSANVELETQFAPDLPRIPASSEHIKSVWINLIINARDAMRDAGVKSPKIDFVTRMAQDDGFVEIIVADNGPGISDAQSTHIFEPFYTTKDPGAGTGLGLATSLRIVDQHGGSIELNSPPGKGATFLIRLPIGAKS